LFAFVILGATNGAVLGLGGAIVSDRAGAGIAVTTASVIEDKKM
jgi:hypothetical protein